MTFSTLQRPARRFTLALDPGFRAPELSKRRVSRLIPHFPDDLGRRLRRRRTDAQRPRGDRPARTSRHSHPRRPRLCRARLESPSETTPAGQSAARSVTRTSAAKHKKGAPTRVAVYFLEPDGKTPLTPLPEKVQALLGLPGTLSNHYIQPYDLASEPKGDDPAAAARFASPPFPLPEQRVSGRVKAVIEGHEVQFPLVVSAL